MRREIERRGEEGGGGDRGNNVIGRSRQTHTEKAAPREVVAGREGKKGRKEGRREGEGGGRRREGGVVEITFLSRPGVGEVSY